MQASTLLDVIARYEKQDLTKVTSGITPLQVPHFSEPEIRALLSKSAMLFVSEPTAVRIDPPCLIIGDLHGSLLDLVRIVQRNGRPSHDNKYVFLGDIVDNGLLSLDTLIFVLVLKAAFPDCVYVIRGDHEFAETKCTTNSFEDSVAQSYSNSDVIDGFYSLFQKLPIAAIVDDAILCVHGGIGPNFTSIGVLGALAKPVTFSENEVVETIVWSDPFNSVNEFAPNRVRGCGWCFSSAALKRFLAENKLSMLVRGHEVRKSGVSVECEGMLVTVFSSSNYLGCYGNQSGVLYVQSKNEYEARRYEPLGNRLKVQYVTIAETRPVRRHQPTTMSMNDLCKCSRRGGCLLGKLALQVRSKKLAQSRLFE